MNEIEKLEEKGEEILKRTTEKEATAKAQLEKAINRLHEIEQAMKAAIIDGKTAEHVRLSEEKDTILKELEACRAQVQLLAENTAVPFVTEEEYNSAVSAILAEGEAVNQADKQRILGAMETILEIGRSNKKSLDRLDHVLKLWQEKLYKNTDMKMDTGGGRIIMLAGREKKIKDRSVCNFAREIENGHYRRLFLGIQEQMPEVVRRQNNDN